MNNNQANVSQHDMEARAKAHAEYAAQFKNAHNLHTPDFEVWLKCTYPKLYAKLGYTNYKSTQGGR